MVIQGQSTSDKALAEVVKIVKELAQRIRLIEERISKLENGLNEINTHLHEEIRNINEFKQNITSRLEKLEVELTNQSLNIKSIEKKSSSFARKTELKEIKEYLDLLKPINKVYVTRKEVKELIKKIMDEVKK